MHETLTGFAALALLGFIVGFGMLMLFMVRVQPIWSVVDCAIDPHRGTPGKILWVLALVLLWGVSNWFYGAFAAANTALRNLTRLAWVLAIGLVIAFALLFHGHVEFRRGIERQWQEYGPVLTVRATPASWSTLLRVGA
jgi:ABC-type amino acid transport system permease subunit